MDAYFFNVLEFCKSHKISRALLFKLWKSGDGPNVTKVGRRTLITTEAAAEWRERMTLKKRTDAA